MNAHTSLQIGDHFTVKGGAVEYKVVRVGDYGSGRTIHGERVDGRLGSTLYFRPERVVPVVAPTPSVPPTRAGQVVCDAAGRVGVTTDWPRTRTPQISVQWVGGRYPVLEQIDSLIVRTEGI